MFYEQEKTGVTELSNGSYDPTQSKTVIDFFVFGRFIFSVISVASCS
jgi:hypothetical protein